jgi:hypothetical protein
MMPAKTSPRRRCAQSASPIEAPVASALDGQSVLAEGPVRAVPVVVLDVLSEHPLKVTPSEDEHAVEALSPDGTHEPLGDRVRPRRPDRSLDDPDSICGEDGVEGRGELGVSVTDEELDRRRLLGELHGDVPGQLGYLVADRLGRHAGYPDESAVVVDEEEDIEVPKVTPCRR